VVSNAFEQSFFGDDFQVYRQLRRLNPSPYLFYFDFEDYRLFGSSPEAQLVIEKEFAEIHPIAGTIPRTGVKETDDLQLEFLLSDAKENAEHTMLVDLARNDLSRNCSEVNVANYKEVQHFSHVTHLVSKVIGKMDHKQNFKALCNSFPAGTLSGTPKPKALELIHQYENSTRDYYGGAIGIFTANDDLNMAIVIRSMLSKNNTLHYRAGAGVVINSIPDRETKEVHHKLRAVRTAIEMTQNHFKKELKCK
jgi:anthranilate synthase component 1